MTTRGILEDALLAQDACFALAFADDDPPAARGLHQPDVAYVSPTVRLFDCPARIDVTSPSVSPDLDGGQRQQRGLARE